MSDTSNFSDEEFQTAIAAAAYAVALLAEEGSPSPKRLSGGSRRSPTEAESKKDGSIKNTSESIRISSNERRSPGGKSMRKSTTLRQRLREDIADTKKPDKYLNDTGTADTKKPDKAIGTTPTMKKMPTFSDTYLNDTGMIDTKKPGKAIGTTPSVKKMPTFSDTYLNDTVNKRFGGSAYQNDVESQKQETDAADSWEREDMAKIIKWHEKMNSTILQWENEKKTRARRKKERKERELDSKWSVQRELELRRAGLLQEHRNEMSSIDKIAGGARKVTDERRRNDELKTKEIARMIRSSGEVPSTWFCICN